MSKKYSIPISWESYRRFEVEADGLEEAIEKALKEFLMIPDEFYLDDSFEIDDIIYEEYPDEDFDIHDIYENL